MRIEDNNERYADRRTNNDTSTQIEKERVNNKITFCPLTEQGEIDFKEKKQEGAIFKMKMLQGI